MDKFYTLEEFLLLKEQYGDNRSIHEAFSGLGGRRTLLEDSVWLYRIAKITWELYGDDGPPIDSIVYTLRSGFGCASAWARRKFLGVHRSNFLFFSISRKDNPAEDRLSLVDRNHWWAEITTKDAVEKLNDPMILREFKWEIDEYRD